MSSQTDVLAKLKARKEASDLQAAATSAPTLAPPLTPTLTKIEVEEKTFNIYKASMQAFRIIRPDGKVIHVLNGQLITDNPIDIEYLDAQIALGKLRLRPAEQVTSTDLDPIAALKAKLKEEARQEILAETASSSATAKLAPASTSDLVDTSAMSDSVSS